MKIDYEVVKAVKQKHSANFLRIERECRFDLDMARIANMQAVAWLWIRKWEKEDEDELGHKASGKRHQASDTHLADNWQQSNHSE